MKDIISDLFEDWIFLHKKVGDLIYLFIFLNILVIARIIFSFNILHLGYFFIMNNYIIKYIILRKNS